MDEFSIAIQLLWSLWGNSSNCCISNISVHPQEPNKLSWVQEQRAEVEVDFIDRVHECGVYAWLDYVGVAGLYAVCLCTLYCVE